MGLGMARTNRYPGRCTRCGGRVQAQQGWLGGGPSHWTVTHKNCSTAPRFRPTPTARASLAPPRQTHSRPQARRRSVPTGWMLLAAIVVLIIWSNYEDGAGSSINEGPTTDRSSFVDFDSGRSGTTPSATAPSYSLFTPDIDLPDLRLTCGGGSYTTVDGVVVPGPVCADSAPPGASAQCRDGTYSFSQNRRGTCSRHGGVASWL